MSMLQDLEKEIKVLKDKRSSGKTRDWKNYKSNADILADSFIRLGRFEKADKLLECGSSLKFWECPNGHEKRLKWGNFCRERLCPMCMSRRSLILAHQVYKVAHVLAQRQKVRWVMLTLTVDNPHADDLKETIDDMMQGWQRLTQRKAFKDRVIGWTRSLEVKPEKKRFGYYHPHFHCLLAVKPSYFTHGYMKKTDWAQLWGKCLKVSYVPNVGVNALKQKSSALGRDNSIPASGVAEVVKYTVKADDIIEQATGGLYDEFRHDRLIDTEKTDMHVRTLQNALKGRRLFAIGGELKKIFKELGLDDAESGEVDLVHTSEEDAPCQCSACGSDMLEWLYSWIPKQSEYVGRKIE